MAKIVSDEKLSRFLSAVLRHTPELIGITLDGAGWTDIDTLIRRAGASSNGAKFDRIQLAQVVANCPKKRFTVSEDMNRIRAAQGHSVKVDLGLKPHDEPPAILYHGTATRFIDSILAQGINTGERQTVHLSADPATAFEVGRRHGNPVAIGLNVQAMLDAGYDFFKADNGVWLTQHVEPKFFKAMMYER